MEKPTEFLYNEVLLSIKVRLAREEVTMANLGLLEPNFKSELEFLPVILQEGLNFEKAALHDHAFERYPTLNAKQKYIFDQVVGSVIKKEGKIFCLNASGGSEKTYTINLILTEVWSQGHIAVATAVSGIAANLLENERPLYSRCSIPLRITEEYMCHMKISDSRRKFFQKARLLVIDEVTMDHKHVYECIDPSLREVIQETDKLFGDLTVLFSREWKQILPMVQRGSRPQIIPVTLKQSYIWNYVQSLQLSVNTRVQNSGSDDTAFTSYLDQLRNGTFPINQEIGEYKISILPPHLTLQGYRSFVKWSPETEFPLELINDLNPLRIPPHILVLKKHSSIMLLRNLKPTGGHCNGTRYIVLELHNHLIEAKVVNGTHAGIRILIP
uniref:ATP-dependent DNA helicase n=1 Tax=Octopus bimaculoides TaxID=37653 RepID=A0A0L8GP75_OCTBM